MKARFSSCRTRNLLCFDVWHIPHAAHCTDVLQHQSHPLKMTPPFSSGRANHHAPSPPPDGHKRLPVLKTRLPASVLVLPMPANRACVVHPALWEGNERQRSDHRPSAYKTDGIAHGERLSTVLNVAAFSSTSSPRSVFPTGWKTVVRTFLNLLRLSSLRRQCPRCSATGAAGDIRKYAASVVD